MADNTFTHACFPPPSLSICLAPLPPPKSKATHTRKHARTQTPSCTITLFEDRDACSLRRGTVKPAVCLEGEAEDEAEEEGEKEGEEVCMCVKGGGGERGCRWWQWRRRRVRVGVGGQVRTSSSLPDSDAVRTATMAAWRDFQHPSSPAPQRR